MSDFVYHVGDNINYCRQLYNLGYRFSSTTDFNTFKEVYERMLRVNGRESCLDLTCPKAIMYASRAFHRSIGNAVLSIESLLGENNANKPVDNFIIVRYNNVYSVCRFVDSPNQYYEPIGDLTWKDYHGAQSELQLRIKNLEQ